MNPNICMYVPPPGQESALIYDSLLLILHVSSSLCILKILIWSTVGACHVSDGDGDLRDSPSGRMNNEMVKVPGLDPERDKSPHDQLPATVYLSSLGIDFIISHATSSPSDQLELWCR